VEAIPGLDQRREQLEDALAVPVGEEAFDVLEDKGAGQVVGNDLSEVTHEGRAVVVAPAEAGGGEALARPPCESARVEDLPMEVSPGRLLERGQPSGQHGDESRSPPSSPKTWLVPGYADLRR
jgi:hypothetical protein